MHFDPSSSPELPKSPGVPGPLSPKRQKTFEDSDDSSNSKIARIRSSIAGYSTNHHKFTLPPPPPPNFSALSPIVRVLETPPRSPQNESLPQLDQVLLNLTEKLAENDKTPKESYQELLLKAQNGDAFAMYRLGRRLAEGNEVQQNIGEAIHWYQKSSELGFLDSNYELGSLYEEGKGIPVSYEEAAKWYKKGAELGDAECIFEYEGLVTSDKIKPDHLREIEIWLRRVCWKDAFYLQNFKEMGKIDSYYELTARLPIKWKDLCRLLTTNPKIIPTWLSDHEFHEKVGITFTQQLPVTFFNDLPPQVMVAFINRLATYIVSVRVKKTLEPAEEKSLKEALDYLRALRDLCQTRDFLKKSEVMDSFALVFTPLWIQEKDYLGALPFLRETQFGQAKLAALLFHCDEWVFPLIATHINRNALIAGLLINSGTKYEEDLQILSQAIGHLRPKKREKIPVDMDELQHYPEVRSIDVKKLIRDFLALLSKTHLGNYFHWHTIKALLKAALDKHPQIILFHQLDTLEESDFQACDKFKPSLFSNKALIALKHLVQACVYSVDPKCHARSPENWKEFLSQPMIQRWIQRIPDFDVNLKPLQSLSKTLLKDPKSKTSHSTRRA